ncbi:MAG TPA: hypothetical protein VJ826_09125 [Candidatus Polarisedimenticolaceae bacterium]|nr:hypothetical protein [Candidatus Polarisedimenticolaceae bacterium]
MRRGWFVFAVLIAAVLAASCDSSQPTVGGSTTAAVQIEARANVELYDCYDRFVGTTFNRAECRGPVTGSLTNRSVPWRYSFRVILVHADRPNDFEIVGNSISAQNGGTFPTFGDVARFDPTAPAAAPILPDEGIYNFQNPRRISQGNPEFFTSTIVFTDGRQERGPIQLPVVNILGNTSSSPGVSPEFTLALNPGDSVIVEAAKQLRAQGPDLFPDGIAPSLLLSGRLFVNGSQTTPHAGTVESTGDDGSGISFNYISD